MTSPGTPLSLSPSTRSSLEWGTNWDWAGKSEEPPPAKAKVTILLTAAAVITSILGLHGAPWKKPARGGEYKKSAATLESAASQLSSSEADPSLWDGAAAQSYNEVLDSLITQVQVISGTDLRVQNVVADQADDVWNARIAIQAAAGVVALAIPVAIAMTPETSIPFQIAVATVTVGTALSAASFVVAKANMYATKISAQTSKYTAAAKAAKAASGSSSGTSDGVSVDPQYLEGLAGQVSIATSETKQASRDVNGLVAKLWETHGVICGESITAMKIAQQAHKEACMAAAQRTTDLTDALNKAANSYQNTDQQQRDSLNRVEFDEPTNVAPSDAARTMATDMATPATVSSSPDEQFAPPLASTATIGDGKSSGDASAVKPLGDQAEASESEVTPAYASPTAGQVAGRAPSGSSTQAAPSRSARPAEFVAEKAPAEEAAVEKDVSMDVEGAAAGTADGERAPIDIGTGGAQQAQEQRPLGPTV